MRFLDGWLQNNYLTINIKKKQKKNRMHIFPLSKEAACPIRSCLHCKPKTLHCTHIQISRDHAGFSSHIQWVCTKTEPKIMSIIKIGYICLSQFLRHICMQSFSILCHVVYLFGHSQPMKSTWLDSSLSLSNALLRTFRTLYCIMGLNFISTC